MRILRRFLYIHAAVWAVSGLGLAIAPGLLVETLFDQPALPDRAWLRIAGLLAVGMAMFAVLVAQRAREVWWWAWAFVFPAAGIAAVAGINALGGAPEGAPSALWWIVGLVNAGLVGGLIWGLGRTAQERSPT